MAEAEASEQPKIIVVPRQLEGFFYDKLRRRYAGRGDVTVIVDRRQGERRRAASPAPTPIKERRRDDRRHATGSWSLDEMPFTGA